MFRNPIFVNSMLVLVFIILFTAGLSAAEHADNDDIVIGKYRIVHSDILGEDRQISVYLPYNYDQTADRYPVLYLLDGDSESRLMLTASTMEDIESRGGMPPMIVIGIDSPDATRDYFPFPYRDRPGTGQAENFLKFITTELVPWVEDHYRAVDYKILCGCSNAGLFTVNTFLAETTAFNAYIAASPSVGWFPDSMLARTKESLTGKTVSDRAIYMNYADDDLESIVSSAMPAFVTAFSDHASADLRWTMEVLENAGHVPYISYHNGLNFIFDGWKYPDSNLSDGGLEALQNHYGRLSDRYRFNVKVPSGHLADLAMDYFQTGDWDNALEVFDYYSIEYPNSARCRYLMGATYEKRGDTAAAISHLEKAVKLDPDFVPAKRKLEQLKAKRCLEFNIDSIIP